MSAVGNRVSANATQARLGEIDPDFLSFVPDDERQAAAAVALPAVDLDPGPFDPHELLVAAGAECAIVVTGIVDRHIHVDQHVALRILGPGAIIADHDAGSSALTIRSQWTATGPVRLALLGRQFLRAAGRWQQLQRNLIGRFSAQNEQLAAQLALCQMPRVEDRLLTMLWLLAESWGKVTPAGTLLPVRITHEALGAMVGARRPTVTLALRELADTGAVLQRPSGWLLLKPPPEQRAAAPHIEPPQLLELEATAWARQTTALDDARRRRTDLLSRISRLREEHHQSVSQQQARLRRAKETLARASEVRDRVRQRRRAAADRRAPNGDQFQH